MLTFNFLKNDEKYFGDVLSVWNMIMKWCWDMFYSMFDEQ
jgi:hypothetical protein